MLRRVGAVEVVDLNILDLCDATIRDQLGLSETDLLGDDYSLCQAIGDELPITSTESSLLPPRLADAAPS